MRLIDADALRMAMYEEAFENDDSYNETNPMAKWDSGLWIRYKMFENTIDKVPTIEPKQEWIPCSERLPEEEGDYLVTLENGVVKILGYSTTQRTTYPKGFYYIKNGFSWRQEQNPVVAWMPLPEPWKRVDDDSKV